MSMPNDHILTAAYQLNNHEIPVWAIFQLAHANYTPIVPKLRALLSAQDARVRWASAIALGKFRDTKAVALLENAVASDDDRWVRAAAVRSLGQIGDRSAMPAIITALNDRECLVRIHAIRVLGKLGNAEDLAALKPLLKDQEQCWLSTGERVADVARDTLWQFLGKMPTLDDPMEWLDNLASGLVAKPPIIDPAVNPDNVVYDDPYFTWTSKYRRSEDTSEQQPQQVVPSEPAESLPMGEEGELPGWYTGQVVVSTEISSAPPAPYQAPLEPVAPLQPLAEPAPSLPPSPKPSPADDDPLGGMDPMQWLESLAARQGANQNEFTTSADLEIEEIDPDSVVIDEPGYTPSEKLSRSIADVAREQEARRAEPAIAADPLPDGEFPDDLDPMAGSSDDDILGGDLPPWLASQMPATDDDADQVFVDEIVLPSEPDDSPDWLASSGNAEPQAELAASDFDSEDALRSKTSLDAVRFTAFYPRKVETQRRYALIVYTHSPGLLNQITQDVKRFEQELGGQVPDPKSAKQTSVVERGTAITVVPESDELEFEPANLTKTWDGSWRRYDFDFQPTDDLDGETVLMRVSIQISGIEIAHIRCALDVQSPKLAAHTAQPSNPLKLAQLESESVAPYQKIFISYSRQDKLVAEIYRWVQMALGNDVFMDTYSIRSGENWRAALARAIDSADIFQLFWSQHAANSPNVRDEWDYALKHRCPADQSELFIRPVFWQVPMPAPPPNELSHLNFRYIPLQSESKNEHG